MSGPRSDAPIGVIGAGAIGCFLGGKLSARGVPVVLIGRERSKREIDAAGLVLRDLDGGVTTLPAGALAYETDIARLAGCGVVLCCVKSGQTAEAAAALDRVLGPGAIVISMQNGVHNADVLRAGLGSRTALGGIVGFNVVADGPGSFRRTTSGPLVIERAEDDRVRALAVQLDACGFEVDLSPTIRPMQWSKLIMNLNNAVGALTDVPTRELLFTHGYRRILAAVMAEALAVMKRAGVRPAKLGAIPVGLFPLMLRLPTPVLRIVARAQLKIDPQARSSMWEDVSRRRLTEVDFLNGEIVRLAASCGADAPLNRRVVELVHEVEKRGQGSPRLGAEELWGALTR